MGEIYPEEEAQSRKPRFKKTTLVLDTYGINLSKAAIEGKLDPVIGRTDEILRVIQILGRRRKNNPVLVGEPGVGKCVIGSSLITIKNSMTGEISTISIDEFNNMI